MPVIPLIVKSVTVSPSSFNFIVCGYPVGNRLTGGYVQYTGDQMTLPNGECGALADSGGPVGVTAPGLDTLNITNNGTTPEFISVQATDAVPADNGTPWKLTTQPPGLDQFAIWNGFQDNYLASTPTYLTHAPAPDKAVQLGVGNQGILAPGTTAHEQMGIEGPSASSDLSTQFSTTITWIAS